MGVDGQTAWYNIDTKSGRDHNCRQWRVRWGDGSIVATVIAMTKRRGYTAIGSFRAWLVSGGDSHFMW